MNRMVRFLCLFICLASVFLIGLRLHQVYGRQSAGRGDLPGIRFPADAGRIRWGWTGDAVSTTILAENPGVHFDFTAEFHTDRREADGSPEPAGFLYHYHDADNYAFIRLDGEQAVLGRVDAGAEILLARNRTRAIEADRTHRLLLRRRGLVTTVAVDGRLLAAAYDESMSGGQIRLAGMAVELTHLNLQKIENPEVIWSDDFMRDSKEPGDWSIDNGGLWGVLTMTNPSRSANAFSFRGVGKSTLAVAGEWWWDRYTYTASMRGPAGGRMGLAFALAKDRNGARNGYLFRWSEGDGGAHEIVKLIDGREELLRREAGGYRADQWYRVALDVGIGRVSARVDGRRVLEVRDEGLLGGRIGLWADADGPDLVHRKASGIKERPPVKGRVVRFNVTGATLRQGKNGTVKVARSDIVHIAYGGVIFDDVTVTHLQNIGDDFSSPAFTLGGWQPLMGSWRAAPSTSGAGAGITAASSGHARALYGSRAWENYAFSVQARPGPGGKGSIGLLFNYRDESRYDQFKLNSEGAWLTRVRDGRERILGRAASVPLRPGRLAVDVERGHIAARVDGRVVLEAWDPEGRGGRVGLTASGAAGATFRDARVDFIEPPAMVLTSNVVFDNEHTMKTWAGYEGDWRKGREPYKGVPVYWHRAMIYGDTEISMELDEKLPRRIPAYKLEGIHRNLFGDRTELLPEDKKRLQQELDRSLDALRKTYAKRVQQEVGVSLAKATGRSVSPNNGYVLKVRIPVRAEWRPTDDPKRKAPTPPLELRMFRDGESIPMTDAGGRVHEVLEVPMPDVLDGVALRQAGSFVLAKINGAVVGGYSDPEPKKGGTVAYFARGIDARHDHIRIFNRNLLNYAFSRAPVDWRVGAGTWAVASRWQCDPRWSLFSGWYRQWPRLLPASAPQHEKLAVIWNKRSISGDFSIECFAGPKMQREAGSRYEYVRDLNISVLADGRDLTSGYLFSFGAAGNRKTALYRKGVLVPDSQSTRTIPRDIHRSWFSLKVTRLGDTLRFYIYDDKYFREHRPLLTFTDPEPLRGPGEIAVWTYRMGMMLSRVRISAEHVAPPREPWKTPSGAVTFKITGEDAAAYDK